MRSLGYNIILLIFFISSTSFCYSQSQKDLREVIDLIINKNSQKIEASNTARLPEISKITDYCSRGKEIENWFWVDLNNDNIKDPIFSGPCSPYFQTNIFLNTRDNYKELYEVSGKLISIKDPTSIIILKESIACDYYSNISLIKFNKEESFLKTISFHFETQLMPVKKFEEIYFSGIVRTSPKINDTISKDLCTSKLKKGNHISVLKNQKVIILNSKGSWHQIIFKVEKSNSIIGWIPKFTS